MLAMEMHIQHVGIYVNRMILECMACLIALQQSMIYYLYVDILSVTGIVTIRPELIQISFPHCFITDVK